MYCIICGGLRITTISFFPSFTRGVRIHIFLCSPPLLSTTDTTTSDPSGNKPMLIGVTIAAVLAVAAIIAFLMARWVFAVRQIHVLNVVWPLALHWPKKTISYCCFKYAYATLLEWECFCSLICLCFQEKEVVQTPVIHPHRNYRHWTLRTKRDIDSLCTKNQ